MWWKVWEKWREYKFKTNFCVYFNLVGNFNSCLLVYAISISKINPINNIALYSRLFGQKKRRQASSIPSSIYWLVNCLFN